MKFAEILKKQVLVLDGGMGTMVQGLNLTDADFGGASFKMLTDLLAFSRPKELEGIHFAYLQAGANIIETNTFGASAMRLSEYDFSKLQTNTFQGIPDNVVLQECTADDIAYHANVQSAKVAYQAKQRYQESKEYDGRLLFVFGCIGPSNYILSSTPATLNKSTYPKIVQNFYHQVLGLIDGGVDGLSFDTAQDQLELKAAIHGAQKACRERNVHLPMLAHVTVDSYSKMQIFNTDILAVLTTVGELGLDAFGINCSIGPDLMETTVRKLSEYATIPLSIVPNAGLPMSEGGKTIFKLTPEELAAYHGRFVEDYGVSIVGGCCGTGPDHIKAVAQAVKGKVPKKRETNKKMMVSGPQNAVALDSDAGLIRIGERLNVRGSKKVREAVESSDVIDYGVLEEVVEEQTKDLGIAILDVCMDSNIVQTEQTLCSVLREMTKDFPGVFCLDSFSVPALIQAAEAYSGKPIINSISLEEYEQGVDKLDAVVSKTHHHKPVYIALCADSKGPAKTADEKYKIAQKIVNKCADKYGVVPAQLIIDVNAFPIGSESEEGANFAWESLQAMEKIKSIHPDLMISMGVGNLTNGLAKKPYMRLVLTSVFLHEARLKGINAAIVNPQHYVPIESIEKEHVALARKVIFEHDMDAFSQLEDIALERKGTKIQKRTSYDDLIVEEAVCQKIKEGFKQREKGTVVRNDFSYDYEDAIVKQVAVCVQKYKPLVFINDYLMKTMQELGDGFARGEVSLPHLLKSADVMKQAMGYIETYLKQISGDDGVETISKKGVVVLGTVYQDVHSIGKDLVKTLLENYGYQVIDLGVQVPLEKFVEEAKKHKAQAIGMSALLVQTSNHMIDVARQAKEMGLKDCAILIGGAPVNKRHAFSVAMWGQEDLKEIIPHVFYCSSAMDGVNVMNQYTRSEESRDDLVSINLKKLKEDKDTLAKTKKETDKLIQTLPRRYIPETSRVVCDDACSPASLLTSSIKDFCDHIDTKKLFSLNWRFGGKNSWLQKGVSEDVLQAKLKEWLTLSEKNKWLQPQAVYGLYPCQSEGDTVIVYGSQKGDEIARITFNPVVGATKKDVFSAAQFFLPKETKKTDLIGLQIATAGSSVDKQIQSFKDQGNSEEAYLLQGLSDRIAEDMAAFTHNVMRRKLGLTEKQGTRYSPGYPGLKNIKVNHLLFDVLEAKERLQIDITDAGVFYPTGTTAAVVCFYPEATYT
jgi:5-methyltetrahydrofolate--homocysteine methyltransferase